MHTDDIYKLATSSGKLPILAEAFDHVLHTATLYDVPLTARYLKSDLLSYDRLHLAEHHLYGSSRLGIQRYLPSEYSYTASSTEGSTYDRLPESRSWYSRYANDLFSSGLSSNALTSYNLSLSDLPLFNHILGNRQFELTNHLGNVQSTVLDRTHPRIGFAGNGSVITGYQANIASAQDYFPFGMYMPGRYISDTVQHCITVTKRIRVPRFMPWRFFPVTSYPPVFGTLSTHVFRYGDPVVPGVHELSKATLMADEKPYVYHLLPASQHIGGAVLKAAAGPDSTAEYTIDLGGEPAPVYSYLHLHPDTALAIQSLNVTVHHSPGVLVEARIRQYNASGVEDFSVPLDWQPLPEGQPYALDFATDVTAIMAGGATMLEYRTSPVGGGTFAAASEVTYTSTIVTVSLSELRDVLVTICDEKDNYRFGFNGQEKVNEVNGIGNHNTALFWEYDTRLGRRWNLDPIPQIGISDYAVNINNPIKYDDPNGDCPTCLSGAIIGAFTEYAGIVGSKMLFEGMSFEDANGDLGWQDGLDISIAAAFGAASGAIDGGISKWTAWISKPTNQKIAAKILEVGISALESSLKQIYKDEDFDLKSILAGAMAEVGVGSLLKTDVYKNAAEDAASSSRSAASRAEDLMKRNAPNQRLVKNAQEKAATEAAKAKSLNQLDVVGKVAKGGSSKTISNGAQNAAKDKNEKKEKSKPKKPHNNYRPVIPGAGLN